MVRNAASTPAARRRHSVRRRLALGGAVLLALIAAALAALHTGPARRYVLARVTEILAEQNIDVRSDELRFNLLALSADLSNVTIASDGTPDAPLATIGRLDANLSLLDVIRGSYVLESARIDALRLHYLVYADGTDNLPRPPSDPDDPSEPLDYLIADGRITDAVVRYENRATGVDLVLPIRELVVEGDRATSRHAVTLDAAGGRLVTGDRVVPLDRLDGELDLGRDDVAVETLAVESAGSRADLAGTLERFADPVLDVRLEAAIDAARAASLAGLEEAASGNVTVEAEATGPIAGLAVSARIDGRDLAWRELRDLSMALDARYDAASGLATAESLELRAPWGTVTGRGTVVTQGTDRSTVELTAADVNAGVLMRAFDSTVVAATRVDARATASWPGLDYQAASGTAAIDLSPTATRPAPNVLPVSGRLDVAARTGRVAADIQRLEAAGVNLTGQVTLADRARLEGVVHATAGDVAATAAMLEAFTDRPAGSLLPRGSSGAITATATVGGTTSAPVVRATVDAPALTLAETEPLAVFARMRYEPDALTLDTLDAAWAEARAHAEGHVGLAAGGPLALTFEATSLDLPSLLAAAGRDPSTATGSLSLTGRAEGTIDQPRVAASLIGRDLVVSREALGVLTADARLEGREATLERLVLDKPQPDGNGRLTATGTYDLDTRAYSFTVDSENLAITSLRLPDGRAVGGRVTLDASGTGTLDDPAASMDVSVMELTIAEHDLGTVLVDADVGDGTANLTLTADRFGLQADARVGTTDPFPATLNARLTSLDLAALPIELRTALTGRLTATVDASAELVTPADLEGRARFESLEGTWNGQPFALAGPADVRLADERVSIDGLTLTAQDSRISLSGTLPLDAEAGTGVVTLDASANLSTLAGYAPGDPPVSAEGAVTLAGSITGNLERIDPTLDLRVTGGAILVPDLPERVTGLEVEARVADGVASVNRLTAQWGAATVTALARIPFAVLPALPVTLPAGSGHTSLTASVSNFNPATMPGSPDGLSGHLSLELEATADRPEIGAVTGLLTFSELDVTFDTLTLAQDQPSTIRIDNGSATIERFALGGSAGTIAAQGSIGLTGQRPLDIGVDGDLSVAAVTAVTDTVRADGRAVLDVTARGTVGTPDLAGTLTLRDGTLTIDEPSVYAESLAARIELADNRITLASLSGTLNGGSLSGHGGLSIVDGAPADVKVELSASDVALEAPLDLRSLSDTTLTITQQDDDVLVSGRVGIQEGGLTGDLNFDTGLLATITAPRTLDLTEDRNPWLERVELNIEVVTETPIVIDNNVARAEVTTDLRVLGTPYETGLSGRLSVLEGGEVTLNERRYAVERGTIMFLDDRRILPSMDLRLTTTAGRYDVTLGVTGEPGETETTLVSTPALPEPDIMALLVTGRTLDEMRGEEYDVAREQVLSYLAERLGASLGRDIEQATGLSEVRLEPNLIANEADPSARLTVGQDLTDDLTLVFSTDLTDSSDQIWVGRYDLTRQFETSTTRQSDGSYRFDLRHDVRLGGQPAPERQPRARPTVQSLRVRGDGVMGEAEARALFGVEPGDDYDYFAAHEGIRDIEATLRERGHLQSRVRLERTIDQASADLVLRVNGGPVVDILYEGGTPPGRVADAVRQEWSRGVFDTQRAGDAIEVLRAWLIDERYLNPEVDYRIEDRGDGTRRVVLTVDRGERFDRVERVFEGASGIEPEVLNDIVVEQDLEREVFMDPLVVTTLLERYYREEGYLTAEIDEPRYEYGGPVARVIMTVREGPRFTVGDVSVSGNAIIAAPALVSDLPLVPGDPYLPRVAARSLDRIRDLYWDRAYNDVRSEYALVLDRAAGRVDVAFAIEEGRPSVVAGVEIQGDDETSERLVREQFELAPSDSLDLSLLSRSRRNLYDTGAFSLVDITRETLDPAAEDGGAAAEDKPVRLTVAVREVQPFQIRYGGSFDTERGPGVIVDVSNHNSLGKARVLGVSGRYDGQLREARLYLNQPSLLYFPIATTASVYVSEERSPEGTLTDPFNVDRRGASIQQERKLANAYIWTYGYRYERARKFGTAEGSATDETITVSPLTSTFLRETRDEMLDASTGSFTSHAFTYSPSWLGADTSYVKYFGQFFRYFPLEPPTRKRFTNEVLRPRFVYAVGVRLGAAWSPGSVPETERFYAGGSTTLRGFEQNSVGPIGVDGVPSGGAALFVLNNEVRVPLFSIVDGVGFIDVGNVFQRTSDISFSDLRRTAGVGLRLRTPWFLVRGDYGVILDRRPGERLSRFYFSIGQAF